MYILTTRYILTQIQSPSRSPLFPYTTLFRSSARRIAAAFSFEVSWGLEKIAHPTRHPQATYALDRSEEHTTELQSPCNLVCRLLLEKKKINKKNKIIKKE